MNDMAKEKKNLLEIHPELCEEGGYENNGNLKPKDVIVGSGKEFNSLQARKPHIAAE